MHRATTSMKVATPNFQTAPGVSTLIDQANARKGIITFDHNWQRLARIDIYRQRVFGTQSGASEFIPRNDKRKLSLLSCVIYVVFVYVTVMFIWPRVPINVKFEVNQAIESSLKSTSFETNPRPRYWEDIQSVSDLRNWLLYGFPTFLTPQVQGYNFPIGAIRFTLRRIQQVPNKDPRFQGLATTSWINKNGINLKETSNSRDDRTSFGAYRDLDPLEGMSGGSSWYERDRFRCQGGELLDLLEEVRYDRERVIRMCKNWCEELVADSKPCRCWQLSGQYKCEFYYMPQAALQNFSTSALRLASSDASLAELAPTARTAADATLYWPRMLRFTYSDSQSGWYNTPGFILYMRVHPQEDIVQAADLRNEVPMTQSQAVFRRIRDWMEGGLLSRGIVGLSIDFVTFNPNAQVFTWIQLTFELEASGHVVKDLTVESLRITTEDRRELNQNVMQRDLSNVADVFYLILVLLYVIWELWELGERGTKYIYSGWNLLTVTSLMLHICTLVSRYVYLSKAEFTQRLIREQNNKAIEEANPQGWTSTFERQARAYADFLAFSSVNLLFVWLQLAHYLNDIVPRIGVLVDTMYRSLTPIIFLVIILADMFVGFVIWANLMFGKSVSAFKDMGTSMYSCTELLFGEVDPYYNMKMNYPMSGILFFFLYMFIFVIVLQNLSKAIVLVSYDDASKSHEKNKIQEEDRKRAAESESVDYLAKKWKQLQGHIKRFFSRDGKATLDKAAVLRRHEGAKKSFSRTGACVFLTYCLMYIVMTFNQVQVYWANTLTRSLTNAIEVHTFTRVNPISGQITSKNFTQVETREEVMAFLVQVLPKTMYNSSVGGFESSPNPLNVYESALPQRIVQLVINNWNIVVGRDQPVRISTRFANMTPVGVASVGTLMPSNALRLESATQVRDTARLFNPPLADARGRDVINPQTRSFLGEYCRFEKGYAADISDSYVCMLSRDYATTMSILSEMERKDFVTNQTCTVVVDFVIYNGYAEAFAYVAIAFAFQPSGVIEKQVSTATIQLDLYNTASIPRAFLEVVILLLTGFYLGQSFSNMHKDVAEFLTETRESSGPGPVPCSQRCLSIFRGVTLHLVLDPFNLLDLVSSVLTMLMMMLWYDIVFMRLRDFFFPELPMWDDAARRGTWPSDSAVIFAFYQAGQKMKWFIRICAVNTVVILLRLLKYLQIFSHVQMLFSTLERAAPDITYFIILMFVILMGYVLMGHQIFGTSIRDFSTVKASAIACFEMFLGTFDSAQLRGADPFKYVFYTYSYVILFRYMLINMFFAIMDKSFIELEEERKEWEQQRLERERLRGGSSREKLEKDKEKEREEGYVKRLIDAAIRRLPSKTSVAPPPVDWEEDFEVKPDEAVERPATPPPIGILVAAPEHEGAQLALAEDAGAQEAVRVDEGVVKRVGNWRYLPQEMRTWAVETSTEISGKIDEWQKARRDFEKKEQHDLDRVLVDAESSIRARSQERWKSAQAVKKELQISELTKLKEIHQDQEALAWYIMKREAELKKLEQTKAKKQERFNEIVQAAKTLISSGEEEMRALEEEQG